MTTYVARQNVTPIWSLARGVPQCLHANCPQMIDKEHWSPISPDLNALESDAWKLHLKPKTVSELKVAPEKTWNYFSQVQLTKLSWVLERGWESIGRLVKNILSSYYNSRKFNSSHIQGFSCWTLLVEPIFDIVITDSVSWLKVA